MFGTGAATGGGLFGTPAASSSAPPSNNLFGTTSVSSGSGGGGLFGGGAAAATSTPAAGGGLFGGAAAKPATGGGLFGNTTTPAVGGSLFGTPAATSASATTSTPAVGGSLFGAPAATTSAPAAGGGLFGGATTTTAPAAGGGLFGGATTTSAPATGGLFGGATTNTTTPAVGGSLFGAPATTSAPATGGGLFGGATTATSASATGGGLFGAAPASTSAPAASGGLFGAGAAPAKPSLFGGASTTAAPTGLGSVPMTAQQSNAQQAVKLDWSNLMPFTKFHELSDTARNEIEQAENHIMGEIQKSEQLAALFPEQREMVTSVSGDAELMERRLLTTESFLQSDFATLESLVASQRADDQAACLSTRTLDLIRLPHSQRAAAAGVPGQNLGASIAPQSSTFGGAMASQGPGGIQQQQSFLPLPTHSSTTTAEVDITGNTGMVAYFTKQTNEMELKLDRFNRTVDEVEASLRSVEATAQNRGGAAGGLRGMDVTGGVGGRQDSRRLNQTLRSFYDAMADVSVRVVEAKEGLRSLKSSAGPAGRR